SGHIPIGVNVDEASNGGQRCIEHLALSLLLGTARDSAVIVTEMAERQRTSKPYIVELYTRMLNNYDPVAARALAARLAKNGTWVDPTLVGMDVLARFAETDFSRSTPKVRSSGHVGYLGSRTTSGTSNADSDE